MNIEQLKAIIEYLQDQRQLSDYDEALETELYELNEELAQIKQQQHTQQLAAFIAKENKWI